MDTQRILIYICIGLVWMNNYRIWKDHEKKYIWMLAVSSFFFLIPFFDWLSSKF